MSTSAARYFTIETSSTSKKGGRYSARTPARAAKHAARVLLADASSATFTLRETTRGSANKSYKYSASVRTLSTPKKSVIAGKTITTSRELKVTPVRS